MTSVLSEIVGLLANIESTANRTPPWAMELTAQVIQIQKGINQIMAEVKVDQAALDGLAAALESVKTTLAAEIASLQTTLPDADLTGLNTALSDLQSLNAPPAAPEPAPSDPSAPASS